MSDNALELDQVADQLVGDVLGFTMRPAPASSPLEDCASACVHITGAWAGAVIVDCTMDIARKATAKLMGTAVGEVSHEDMIEAIGEIANVIAGNIKGMLPGPSLLTLPTVSLGARLRVTGGAGGVADTATLVDAMGETFVVSVIGGVAKDRIRDAQA